MVKIIEHYDYNKPVDNDTVFEVPTANEQQKKLFKAFDGFWLDPEPTEKVIVIKNKKVKISAYQENSMKNPEGYSSFLRSITIALKRINRTTIGNHLLESLHRGTPIEYRQGSETKPWNLQNMITLSTSSNINARKLRATCIIRPYSKYLENIALIRGNFGKNLINTSKTTVYFNPDCVYTIKRGNNIHYFDPAVALFHELTHVLHGIYGTLGESKEEEEYITFGYKDAKKIISKNKSSGTYEARKEIISDNLKIINTKIDSIKDPIDKQHFQDKYGFTANTSIDSKFVDQYIDKYQFTHSEYAFVKELKIEKTHRNSYSEKFFLPFKLDISDPNIYTVEKGFAKPTVTMEELKASNPHLLVNVRTMEDRDMLNECFKGEARSKREIDFKIIPLEPLGEDIDSKESNTLQDQGGPLPAKRAKKSASFGCQDEIIDIIEDLDTVYNKSKEIPKRLLGKHAKEKIINVPEDMELDMPPEDTGVKEEITKLETFKVGELVGIGRITPKDVLNAHRINHDLLEGEEPIYFTSDDFSTSTIAGNQSFTHNKNLSIKMNYMHYGKAVLKTGNAVVNIAQFGMWVDEMIEDFKGDTGKDNLHIANDVLSIVPYLGQVMDIGVDIKDGNYLGAVETLGILVLLEVFPELMLPVFLIGLIVNAIQKNKQQKEMVSKAVWNVLMEREQLLDSQLETEAEHLAHICIERIQKIADHVEQQLTFNAEAIINNIKYYGRKITKNNEDHNKELQKIVYLASTKLGKAIEEKRNKVIETLFTQLKKTIVTDFKEKAQGEIKQFNEQTKTMIKDMLKEHSKDISTSALDEGLKIVEHYMKTHNIGATIKHELDLLVDVIGQGVNVVMHNTGQPIAYSHIGLNKDNKAVDKISNKELKNQNISFAWGRSGNALKFEAGNFLEIDDPLFKSLTLANDFTIEFWIKVPLTKNYDQETTKDIAIIKNSFNNKNGWEFILNGKYLNFTIGTKTDDKIILGSHIISTNKWTKITLVHSRKLKLLFYFINGKIFNQFPTSWIYKNMMLTELNRQIIVSLPQKSKNLTFSIDDFKVYAMALTREQVKASYDKDTKTELLYDYFGNCVRENREYILAVYNSTLKILHPVNSHNQNGYWIYNFDRQPVTLNDYDFTLRIEKKLSENTKDYGRKKRIIYKNDTVLLRTLRPEDTDTNLVNALRWGIQPEEKKNNVQITINDKEKTIGSRHLLHVNAESSFNTFNIFTMMDYVDKDNLNLYNNNIISLAIYSYDTINSLLVAHNNEVLAMEDILENTKPTDPLVKLPIDKNYKLDINKPTYVEKAIFYLFPVNELKYYTN